MMDLRDGLEMVDFIWLMDEMLDAGLERRPMHHPVYSTSFCHKSAQQDECIFDFRALLETVQQYIKQKLAFVIPGKKSTKSNT